MFRIVRRVFAAAACLGLLTLGFPAHGRCEDGPRKIWTLVKVNGADLEYTSTIPKGDVDRLGAYLTKSGFLDGSAKSLRLAPSGEGFELRFPVKEGLDKEPGYLEICKLLCVQISVQVFDKKPVSLRLCDTTWKTLGTVTEGELKGANFSGGTLAYGPGVAPENVEKLGKFLAAAGFFKADVPKVMRIEKNGKSYEFFLIKAAGVELTPELRVGYHDFCLELSVDALDFVPVTVRVQGDGWKDEATFVGLDHGPGLRYEGGVVFRTADVDEAVAKKLGDFLTAEKFFTTGLKPVQIAKRDDTYEFRFIVIPEKAKEEAFLAAVKTFAGELSEGAFSGAPTEVHLCDRDLKSFHAVAQEKK